MVDLLWLGDPKSFDAALVGGKAANLSRLARQFQRVPDVECAFAGGQLYLLQCRPITTLGF
jgi:phosphoenolpyruvate synthase/pyruvate phosphate dikinase